MKKTLIFVNEGKAILPMNQAIREHFRDRFEFLDMSFDEAASYPRLSESIVWMTMGFYRKPLPAQTVIHDYRSLSVGRSARIKDIAKKYLTPKPDYRITKEEIQKVMRFNDGVPTFHIDIAAKDSILEFRKPTTEKSYDFCYIGVINKERGLDRVLQQFIASTAGKTLILVGRVEDDLDKEFAGEPRLTFTGRVPQEEVFGYVNASDVSLAYFPNIYPHNRQTPTKLLEYACLGGRILANRQPMNIGIGGKYGIRMQVREDARLFHDLPALQDWEDNMATDPRPMLFSTHLEESGVGRLLNTLSGAGDA